MVLRKKKFETNEMEQIQIESLIKKIETNWFENLFIKDCIYRQT